MKTVNEVSKLTGISVRTLHHYDKIGLLMPTTTTEAGYRLYSEELTDEYLENLYRAAPMHDIGKIAVPDVVLQKPGKLTDEEFRIIQEHTVKGGDIIKETFGHLENEQYTHMAYEVARHHHEKWNGKGYPDGLKRKEIPLCARIMAITCNGIYTGKYSQYRKSCRNR